MHPKKKTVILERGQKLLQTLSNHAKKRNWNTYSVEPIVEKILAWTQNPNRWCCLVLKSYSNMPLPIIVNFCNHFFGRSKPMDYWNHFYKENKLVFSFIQFIYKWNFIYFSNTKHTITRCKMFVNGVDKCLLCFFLANVTHGPLGRHIFVISPPNSFI